MQTQPIIQNINPAKQELIERIRLSKRPSLAIDRHHLGHVSANLATNHEERKQFLDNPAAYLHQQAIEVSATGLLPQSSGDGLSPHQGIDPCVNVVCRFDTRAVVGAISCVSIWTCTISSATAIIRIMGQVKPAKAAIEKPQHSLPKL